MRIPQLLATSLLSLIAFLPTSQSAQSAAPQDSAVDAARAISHSSPEWALVAPHLPDPATSTPQTLELQADILRVRRFPDDALEFYGYALQRGGDTVQLLNKIGVTQLEMGNEAIARAYFQRVVKMRRKDAEGWNNLGAVQFMDHNYLSAVGSYKKAIKLNRQFAVSHSNLGMAYIELKDFTSAKSELVLALKLDPKVFQHNGNSGVALHMLSTTDRANFCFQMAKVYARMGNEPEMIHSLETAAQAGFDVRGEMSRDRDLARFANDERVVNLVLVAKSLRDSRNVHNTVASALPPAVAAPVVAPAPVR